MKKKGKEFVKIVNYQPQIRCQGNKQYKQLSVAVITTAEPKKYESKGGRTYVTCELA